MFRDYVRQGDLVTFRVVLYPTCGVLEKIAHDPVASAKAAHLRYVTGHGPGIIRKRRGKGFCYIGANAKLVRDKHTLNRIRSLVIPPAWSNVWICPFDNGHIQAVGRDARGRKQYRYHARYREVRDATKYDRMLAFGAALPKIRRAVRRDLARPGLPERKVVAAIVQLMDDTCIRIGNRGYAKSNKSFGLTTLRDRHAQIHGQTLRLHFRGKSGQDHDITLRDRRLAKIVKGCQDLPGQELFQYRSETGELGTVDSADVNEYLRKITGEEFTAKDFRTWHGTGHMAQLLSALGPGSSATERKRNLIEAVKETAKHLGNRPAACRKYYIHPAVLEGYEAQTLFAAMQTISRQPSPAPAGLRAFEIATLRLVQSYYAPREGRKKAS